MRVDPEILRAFATETAQTSDTVDTNTLAGKVTDAFSGMSGSTSAWAAHYADAFGGDLVGKLSAGFDAMAVAARGDADTYEVADDTLATALGRTFPS